jgi:hypothetical protein
MVGMTRTAQSITGYYTPEQSASLPRQQQDYILTQRGTKHDVSMIDIEADVLWDKAQEQAS